jgi:starch synthase (maltosyl-transferring)
VAATRRRVVVRGIEPMVDHGRHPIKRIVGEGVTVRCDVIADGHDLVAAVVRHRPVGTRLWQDAPMRHVGNDRHVATFTCDTVGDHEYRVVGWVDHLTTWREHLQKKATAGVDVPMHLSVGAQLVRDVAEDARKSLREDLDELADALDDDERPVEERVWLGLSDRTASLLTEADPRWFATETSPLRVQVDRERAGFSAWYELFPRSLGGPDRHGTLRDVIDELPRVAQLGFDVLYLPPIHPIGTVHRKGRNNTTEAGPDDVGSPWAIGSVDGGHLSVHPELGTVDDVEELARVAREEHGIDLALDIAFQCAPDHPWVSEHPELGTVDDVEELARVAREEHGIDLALDIAFQCAPDHPWVSEHPEWFRQRPDGSIQYAENPPKKYQDIYPLDFETEDADGLWAALLDVFLFWADKGVRVFRVDNPHTKSFWFWEWCIARLRSEHPDVILLAEAFTRPRVMEELAKRGYHQSYSYFTWREHKWELEQYVREMFHSDHIDWMRPNFWPNTPDILPAHLQHGTRATFITRLVLAALLNANYGVYGPAYEAMEQAALVPGKEEYLDSEKYQLRHRRLPSPDEPGTIGRLMAVLNRVRNEHRCLQSNRNLTLHHVDNPALIAWSKCTDDGDDVVLVVVSLDPHQPQAGTLHLDMGGLRLGHDEAFSIQDQLTGREYRWQGTPNYVELHPGLPAHVFHVRGHDHTAHVWQPTW